MAYQATGIEMNMEISTQNRYSFDKKENISKDLAPFTFLMPISFVLRPIINEDNPISPRQDITIASIEK